MFFIGIDIAKRKHDAVVIDSNGTVIQKAFSFSNSLINISLFMNTPYLSYFFFK